MLPASTLVLLLAALTLAHATQDAAHYALPPNIYDNIPAGLVTPSSFKTYPTPAPLAPTVPAPVAPVSQRDDDGFILPPGSIASPSPLTGPTGFDITTPLLNAIYTPGSAFMMTWSNRETAFPDSWTPPQSILDMITQEANLSGNSLLTKEDMRNLAMIKVQGLRAARMASVIKDSQSFLLKSLRLVSWPLGDGGIDGNSDTGASAATTSGLSPKILSDPGFNLLNINHLNNNNNSNSSYNSARLNILGSAGGALLWTIPADWEYEGEFEIEIPLPPSSSSPIPGQHTSRSFWILRDAMTRQLNPQFNLPSMDQQQETISETNGTIKARAEIQRQRDMGVFLGVAAMMSAFVLVGLGLVVGMYRRKWAAAAATRGTPLPPLTPSETGAGHHTNDMHLESAAYCTRPPGDNNNNNNNSGGIKRRATTGSRNQYADYTSSSATILTVNEKRQSLLLEPLQGDEDAYSPRDLNLSEETLRGVVVLDDAEGDDEDMDEKRAVTMAIVEVEAEVEVGGDNSSSTSTLGGAVGGSTSGSVTPVDASFVDLPLYEHNGSTANNK